MRYQRFLAKYLDRKEWWKLALLVVLPIPLALLTITALAAIKRRRS